MTLTLAVVVLGAFVARLALLARFSGLVGYDAYFYAVQTRNLLEHGRLYYPDTSLLYPVLGVLAHGLAVPAAVQSASAAGGALLPVPVYFLARELARRHLTGLAAAALAAGSIVHLFFSIDFLKSAWALVAFTAFLYAMVRATRLRSWRYALLAAAWAIAAVVTHRSMGPLVLVAIAPPCLTARVPRRIGLALLGVVAAAVILVVGPRALSTMVSANLSFSGVGALREIARGPAALYGAPYVIEIALYHLVALGALGCVVAGSFDRGPVARSRKPRDLSIAASLTLVLLVLVAPIWRADGLLFFRLMRLALVPSLALVALLVPAARTRAATFAALACSLALLAWQPELAARYAHAHPDFGGGRVAVERLGRLLPSDALVVAPHGWQFFVTWTTRARSAAHAPTTPRAHVWYLEIADPVGVPGTTDESCPLAEPTTYRLAPGFRAIDCE
ncbi:MAG: hypothetical protein JWM74_5198 [Myxococcaceae bacterium]|nr:hypothetical protein [Myxococcaceae bacterium]